MTTDGSPPDADARVRADFARQRVMETIGARLARVEDGEVEIVLPFREDLTQQHGFLHAGIVTAVVDSACGYAALTRMAADAGVVSVELKVNLLAPARGDLLRAVGRVVRSGRTVSVVTGDAWMRTDDREVHVATLLGTMMAVRSAGRSG